MPVDFTYGIGKTTNLYVKKFIIAKANSVISGEKYYSNLAENLNNGKVQKYVSTHQAEIERKIDLFINKRQGIIEKQAGISIPPTNPIQRLKELAAITSRMPEHKGADKIENLENIYKYFAEKTRPENFIG